jgi:hypothetical protein
MIRFSRCAVFGAAVLTALLSGCSQNVPAPPSVAELPQSSASSPASSGAAQSKGPDKNPQQTLDTTDAEWWGWWNTWGKCLATKGVPTYTKANEKQEVTFPTKEGNDGRNTTYKDAFAQCDVLRPLPNPALSPDTNPRYMDQYRVEIKCLNDNGMKVTPLPDGGGWNFDGTPTLSEEQQAKVQFECRKKAYGAQ